MIAALLLLLILTTPHHHHHVLLIFFSVYLLLPELLWGVGQFCGECLHPSGREQEGVLKLGSALAIGGCRCPFVRPHHVAGCPLADHGLNGENVARLHLAAGLVVLVVQDVRVAVEHLPNPVPAEVWHRSVSSFCHIILYDAANLLVRAAWFAEVSSFLPCIISHLDEVLGGGVRLAHAEHLRAVAVVPPVVHRHVDVEDVPVLQHR
mmetsp:Transcript_33220/g.54992  ORF Transcript_33220/g.54992 Transcript_33220/m.54992 type:complete len:207 (-) Transcript_33220:572-1192(-)